MSLESPPHFAPPTAVDVLGRSARNPEPESDAPGAVESDGAGATANGSDRVSPLTVSVAAQEQCTMREAVNRALQRYFETLEGDAPCDLYALVIGEVEPPLLEAALRQCGGNQSRAANMLGINRATLRKKLLQYDLIPG